MAKLNLNDEIVQQYLNGADMSNNAYNPLFMASSPEGQISLYDKPDPDYIDDVGELRNQIYEKASEFSFNDEAIAKQYLGDYTLDSIEVYLVVGLPEGVEKFLRFEGEDHIVAVIDLINVIDLVTSIDEAYELIYQYIRYLVAFVNIDLATSDDAAINNVLSPIFTSSFANYLAYYHYPQELDTDEQYFARYIEYQALWKIERHRNAEKEIAHLLTHFSHNANLEDIGWMGKYYLSTCSDKEAYDLFTKSPQEFCDVLLKSKPLKSEYRIIKACLYSNNITAILACIVITWAIVEATIGEYSLLFKTFPLVFAIWLLINQALKYRARYQTRRNFMLYSLVVILCFIFYLIFFLSYVI